MRQGGNRVVRKKYIGLLGLWLFLTFAGPGVVFGKTIVFYQNGFPAVNNGRISRVTLEHALAPMNPCFAGLDSLPSALSPGDLLVLPYGSAFPADDWAAIRKHISDGNILVLGGRPLYVPVYREGAGYRIGPPQNSFSKSIGIMYSYSAPQHGSWKLEWDTDAPFFDVKMLDADTVFVNTGSGGRYRGLGFMVDGNGNRVAAPVVADDIIGFGPPRRAVFLSFEGKAGYWDSRDGEKLILEAARYASFGGLRVYLDLESLTLDPGDRVTGSVDVLRDGPIVKLTLEVLYGSRVLEKRSSECGNSLHEPLNLAYRPKRPGLYTVRAVLSMGDTVFDQYTSGVEVRKPGLLQSGKKMTAGQDYFRLGGKPYLPIGVNYFSTDPYGRAFFVGQSIGGNPYVWENDFSAMEKDGLTIVRTGIWTNRSRYLEQVSGASNERLLNAIEAYLEAAARHHMQVIFTFFAFNPGEGMQRGRDEASGSHNAEINAYLNPTAIREQSIYVRSIVSRFKHVPFLSYDLINEPSYANPGHIWKGNSPTEDQAEIAAWREWLRMQFGTVANLAAAWHVAPEDLGTFERISLPTYEELQPARVDNSMSVRAVDYNHFSQYAFDKWAEGMIHTIRSTDSKQIVTVGQDEGGVTNRLLNQFIAAETDVAYTANHSWWQDDALVWDSVVPKSPFKPNLVEETGPQPVWSLDGTWRLDDMNGLGLEERKLVLAFANAGAGVLHWDWTKSSDFGLMRRDGSQKVWLPALKGIAGFARAAEPYLEHPVRPEIALVLPQSLQLSMFNEYSIEVQQKAVRALYYNARGTAFAVGEYQLADMPDAKLIIVPAPWVFSQTAWTQLISKVRSGATLLISGRIDADDHWNSIPSRASSWRVGYSEEALRTRYVEISWPGDSARLSYPGAITTYLDRGVLKGGKTFADIRVGQGHILYFAVPLELSNQMEAIGSVYRYAMRTAGVNEPYSTTSNNPGFLLAPTQFRNATMYVLVSETACSAPFTFHDNLSGRNFSVELAPGRGALMLVGRTGKVVASYNIH